MEINYYIYVFTLCTVAVTIGYGGNEDGKITAVKITHATKPATTTITKTATSTKTTTNSISTKTIPPEALCKTDKKFTHYVRKANTTCYTPHDALQCFHDPLFCRSSFQSGKRELKEERPTYGEYNYLKQDVWFRVIQHGGIVLLYHPCSADSQVEELRQLASGCLHRYVITPYEKLHEDLPIALVSWGCYYRTSAINTADMKSWIRAHAFHGPASHIHHSGTFNKLLKRESTVVTDSLDSIVCPNATQIEMFTSTRAPDKDSTKSVGEKIIQLRKDLIQHGKRPSVRVTANFTSTKVHPGSAAWAASSLFFLCGILLVWLFYVRVWEAPNKGGYKYEEVLTNDYYTGNSHRDEDGNDIGGFSLLKSRQNFIDIFRSGKKHKERKLDSLSTVNLMVPINEMEEFE